jgi:hypothetical protein
VFSSRYGQEFLNIISGSFGTQRVGNELSNLEISTPLITKQQFHPTLSQMSSIPTLIFPVLAEFSRIGSTLQFPVLKLCIPSSFLHACYMPHPCYGCVFKMNLISAVCLFVTLHHSFRKCFFHSLFHAAAIDEASAHKCTHVCAVNGGTINLLQKRLAVFINMAYGRKESVA